MPVISFKVSASDARAIRARAKASRKTLSAYLRERVLPGRNRRRTLTPKKHPVSGLTYDAGHGASVTEEEVRAALADFP
jgi:mobilization protein NikA